MSIRIAFLLLCILSVSGIIAQMQFPSITELDFASVASDYNTFNEKHVPLSFLSGFELTGDESMLAQNPMEVMFNPIFGVNRDDCEILRWDPVVRVWIKFPGNALRQTRDGSGVYWSASVSAPGVYALLKGLEVSGSTKLLLPSGYQVEQWRYVQSSSGVVCEGFMKGTTLSIPLPVISPLGEISMRCRVDGKRVEEFDYTPAGILVKRIWKDAAASNASYTVELASNKKP